ncbi:MAG: alanine racemase [Chloroflexota bacterium]
MLYPELDTPALLVDIDIMDANLRRMQERADRAGVRLRPHTKTHRTPALAKRQVSFGARGITVAKLGEAEAMAAEGLDDIFIANEIVGPHKLERLVKLARRIRVAVGVDHPAQVAALAQAFAGEAKPLDVLLDIDTGDARTGVAPGSPALALARAVTESAGLHLRGIFTHEGHSYGAADRDAVRDVVRRSHEDMLATAELLRKHGIAVDEISVGATPAMLVADPLPGITEIRPGTYIFLDAAQAAVIGTLAHCALTVLATVVNRPTPDRVVLDTGVKALTAFVRGAGVTRNVGHGTLKAWPQIHIEHLSDEHGVFTAPDGVHFEIGQRVEIIPNHACPTCNLYDRMYGVRGGRVVEEWPILARGKSQ